jgi:hypothetical protein
MPPTPTPTPTPTPSPTPTPTEPVEEEQLSPEEQAEVDRWLGEEKAKWREEIKAEVRAEIEAEHAAEEARGEKYGEAFAVAAKKLGIKPEAYDDVLKLGEFDMDGEPDPAAIEAQCAKVLEGRDYLKASGEPAPRQRLSADPLGNRGPSSAPKKLQVTHAQLNDLNWKTENAGKLTDIDSWEIAD